MDEIFAPLPGTDPGEPQSTEHIDPFLERRIEKRPWELRSAQWRAWAIAEIAFGSSVEVSLAGRPGYPDFRGLLFLRVPFLDLADHESRQDLFLSWAGADPVLSRVPLVFIFEPQPTVSV